jgi:hypothetical protein
MANSPEANKTVPDIQALFPWSEEPMQFAERAYRRWLQGAETVQSQAMEYWNTGMQKSIDAMNEIAQCQTAAEAFGVQTRLATEAVQGFITESQKVVEQLTELTRTQWAIAESEVTAAAHAGNGNGHATATRSSRRRS